MGAILLEQSDEWEVQRARYITLETNAPMSDNLIVWLPALATRPTRQIPARTVIRAG